MSIAIPSHAEILQKYFTVLASDTTLQSLLGGVPVTNSKVYNHLPQDLPLPAVRVRWTEVNEWDTKDSAGFEGLFTVDSWADSRGDKVLLQIADRIETLTHLQILTLTSGQSLILRHDRPLRMMVEADGLTHHAVQHFKHIATT